MRVAVEAIKELREKTGAGMMDCRRALEAAGGDMDGAVVVLKEQGLLLAWKRKDRETSEGRVFLRADDHKAVLLHLACETDFVSRNAVFVRLGEECLSLAFEGSAREEELSIRIGEAAGRFKENVVLRGLKSLRANQGERLFAYLHGEGRIGAVVSLAVPGPCLWDRGEAGRMAADLALHVAAFGPLFLSRDAVDSEYLSLKEEEFLSDARALGKPEGMMPGIVRGKMNKHLSRVCLLEQGFIREEGFSVGEVLARLKDNGGPDIGISGFLYGCVGR
jgi:elongation factor Ts